MRTLNKYKSIFTFTTLLIFVYTLSQHTSAQNIDMSKRLKGFDQTVEQILKDWNVPGCGIGIVVRDKLVFTRSYGYRDLDKKLPVTPNTLFHIASNTKLFTSTAVGFLVEEGKLDWDKPIKNYVPQIRFYNDELNANVTIRDMLSHRTGISRQDGIWYRSDFTRHELFDRIIYLEPDIPLRQGHLYNNLMYSAAGQIVEYLSGQTWEEFVTSKIFTPLEMSHSIFVTEEMMAQPDYMTPYYEKRDTTILLQFPFYPQMHGIGSAGSIISNINDMSNWLIAQIYRGKFKNEQVIPSVIIKETMQAVIPSSSVPDKYFENLNLLHGMGWYTSSYKGHYLAQHSGAIGGIYSNISIMPADSIGVIVFTNRVSQLPRIIAFTIYDKLLGLPETSWSERGLKSYLQIKETSRQARNTPDTDRVPGTAHSHLLKDYAGIYEDPAYGLVKITYVDDSLRFEFNHIRLTLYHYHYDRFVTIDEQIPDDMDYDKWSIMFCNDTQGNINQAKIHLDQKEVVFTRKTDSRLYDPDFPMKLEGQYVLNNSSINIVFRNNELVMMSTPPMHLVPFKGNMYRIREFSDRIVEFIFIKEGIPAGLKITAKGNTITYKKK